jgi:nucleoside-diphosphate-sugar epimerase
MHVFLAGATGVLGRRIVRLLVTDGHRVTALARGDHGVAALVALGATVARADALDGPAVERVVTAAAPDVVMNQLTDLAGGTSQSNAELRITSSRNLVRAAQAAGARRVVAQSIAWAYGPGSHPATELEPLDLAAAEPRATSVRGIAALEEATREAPEWVLLRYGMLYGPGTWFAPDGLRAEEARSGRLSADADVTSFVHVDDAAAAAVAALTWPTGIVNVCDDEPAAATDWVPAFCRAVGAAPPEPPAVSSDRDRAPWARGADNRRLWRDLGFTPAYGSWRRGFASLGAGGSPVA